MSDKQTGGMGFASWLTIAFIVLKLTGVIDWAWWWVISPIFIKALIVILIEQFEKHPADPWKRRP